MLSRTSLLTCTLAVVCSLSATAQQIKNNTSQLTPAQQLIFSTGEDSLNSYGAGHARTVMSGYGEVAYRRDFNLNNATANLRRAVLFVGHQFTGKIAFFSELEVEDAKVEGGSASGEVSMEQAYLKFALNPRQYITAGLILPRIGIVNENHLPINFNGVGRPLVEQLVIPSTWREIGVAFYGQSTALPLAYSAAIMNGLNSQGFSHGTGFEGGRFEGQNAGANSAGVNASVQYYAGNWKFQLAGYAGGTTSLTRRAADSLQLESGMFGAPLYLAEADVQYSNNGLSLKALAVNVSIPEANNINRAFDNNTPTGMYGAYGEVAYNLLQHVRSAKWSTKQLIAFSRYETIDLNASIPQNGITDGTLK
ncbi:MAG: hypothetical protein EBZ77_15425, partial [Chitinophagia bacterium]|nr:hypothetical protein [Chitinophagia bacterium]